MNWRDRIIPFAEWTTLEGRANRLNFFILSTLYGFLITVFAALSFMAVHYFFLFYTFSKYEYIYIYVGLLGVYFAFLIFASMALMTCITVKRLHDIGLPAVVALVMYISVPMGLISLAFNLTHTMPAWLETSFKAFQDSMQMLNAAVYVYLCLAPGERSANKYGPDSTVPRDGVVFESLDVVNPK